ncbi:MAG: hypothetical protein VKK05_07360 [Synechococcus sp.]|jgi:homoserine acetyltransferase|nr:hypothetical protein [Synechococcus sp.]
MTGPDGLIAKTKEQCHLIENFRLESGQVLSTAHINYLTLGTPQHHENGPINNAVLLIHQTTKRWI